MKRTEFSVVALRLLATYMFTTSIGELPAALAAVYTTFSEYGGETQWFVVPTALQGICYLLGGAAIWKFAPKVAGLIEQDLPELATEERGLSAAAVLDTGLILMGVFVLSEAVPTLVKIVSALLWPAIDTNFPKMLEMFGGQKAIIPWSDIAAMVVRVAFGLWLIFGSRGILVLLQKVRVAGRSSAVES